ncbi:MAG: hypothetical protein MRY67_03660 [Rhodovulum sp.]|nr:hypothetical protein [Rhodovulum sp.]MCI5084991.1 hypothetical protein [Rhodovulum sp.]MEC8630458.1 hypothetical protein [Pseudomonadota bacterium]MEC8795254.1 hypothetical protein [Pseudomonadota bacterium]
MKPVVPLWVGVAALAVLTGCTAPEAGGDQTEQGAFSPTYLGIETRLLDGDLVNFIVSMEGARSTDDVSQYARCAAAQYTLIRGYGFARHVRTKVAQEGGVWRADAVYTISAALPPGVRQIDAEVVVAHCKNEGIPTV